MKIDRVKTYVTERKRPVTADDVAHQFCISKGTASAYLRELEVWGHVAARRQGKRKIYGRVQ